MPRLTPLLLLGLAVGPAACGESLTPPDESNPRIVEGVDLDLLFADPSASEIAAVQADWAGRNPGAAGVAVEVDTVVSSSGASLRVRIVSHDVSGARHYGAVISPSGLVGPAPVIVYAHGGDSGTSVEEVLLVLPFTGALATDVIWVVPSFRSEAIGFAGSSWTSDGPPSPWDWDVDDALSLLDVTLDIEAAADLGRIAVLGFSRGAGVALIMGIRDDRIDRIVEFFGPTDFFDVFVQDVVEQTLQGSAPALPGVDFLDEAYLTPLKTGALSIADVRRELIRRSAVLYAEQIPDLQLHHGTADAVVAVSQAESLIATMEGLGRGLPDFDAHIYQGGGHNPLTLTGSIESAASFLSALLPVAPAAR